MMELHDDALAAAAGGDADAFAAFYRRHLAARSSATWCVAVHDRRAGTYPKQVTWYDGAGRAIRGLRPHPPQP